MVMDEKTLKIESLELALTELDNIIKSMKENNYSHSDINEYVKKRWNVWNELYKVKKS